MPPDSMENTLILGKIESRSRSRQQRIRWLNSITDSMDMSFSKLQEGVKDRGAWEATVHAVTESDITWQLSNNNNMLTSASSFSETKRQVI